MRLLGRGGKRRDLNPVGASSGTSAKQNGGHFHLQLEFFLLAVKFLFAYSPLRP